MDKNVQIYIDKENPEEEINHSYANGFISEKEKTYKKEKPHKDQHATFAPCSLNGAEQVASTNQAENKSVNNIGNHHKHKEYSLISNLKLRTLHLSRLLEIAKGVRL